MIVASHLLLLTVCLGSVSVYFDCCGASVYLKDHMSKKGMSNVSLWSTESTKWAWVFPLVLCWLSVSPSAQFQDWSCCTPPIRRKDPSINVSLHVILQACSVHPSGWGWVLQHITKDLNEVVQTPQVPVLPVSFGPGRSVVQGLGWRQWDGLTKVNHPDSGQAWSIVHEQQRTPNHLERNRAKFWDYETWFVVFQRWQVRISQHGKNRFLTSCVLKNSDVSRALRSSSSLCR